MVKMNCLSRIPKKLLLPKKSYTTKPFFNEAETLSIQNNTFKRDDHTNITNKILSLLGRNLHTTQHHPLSIVRQQIVDYFYKAFVNARGNPIFSVYDNLPAIVTVEQNFDSLLIPKEHPSRAPSDCYYLNRNYLLRAHTTAHQAELIKSGLNNFLIAGDVYRRDEIDRTHYPVFHQLDAVRLKNKTELFGEHNLKLFDERPFSGIVNEAKQEGHSLEAYKLIEHELKSSLVGLVKELFGADAEYRWVDSEFPFTKPSWELEVFYNGEWLEVLGCGVIVQGILEEAGVGDRIGWAFGLGLERLAMRLFGIPDIRLFWLRDSGFLSQFRDGAGTVYKAVSLHPQCINDISFWLPMEAPFCSNDFYDLVRNVGGDMVEQVVLKDQFEHPKSGRTSHCYRIVYRHMEKTLTNAEANIIHKDIEEKARRLLGVDIR